MLGTLYAAEAYHSRGAVRHVVGKIAYKDPRIELTFLDLWCSMIENWGDSLKELNKGTTSGISASATLIKASKYLYRTWDSIKRIWSDKVPVDPVVSAIFSVTFIFLIKYFLTSQSKIFASVKKISHK